MSDITKQESVNRSFNPEFVQAFPDWTKMKDTSAGEREIKEATTLYLPKTEGQKNDKQNGNIRYANYVLRANYFNYVADTAISMLGVMYSEGPDTIELPTRIEGMKENATPAGSDLLDVERRINNDQLIYGRYGILVDVPTGEGASIDPFLIEYKWDNIINWNTTVIGNIQRLDFVVLNESGNIFNQKTNEWEFVESYRLLALDASKNYYSRQLSDKDLKDVDILNPPIVKDGEGNEVDLYPKLAGKGLDFIPFSFINTTHTLPSVEKPPLLALANLCIAIYRGEADYRQALFMEQNTVFITGMSPNEPLALGAGGAIVTEEKEATMQFVGPNSQTLPQMESSQQDLHEKAQNAGIALIDQSNQESGEALKTRLAIKTANMSTIALTGAVGLKQSLQHAAIWANANPDEVIIIPNLDFASSTATAQQVLQLWTSKLQGIPLSVATIHEWLRQNDFTTKTLDEEQEEIENEALII